MKYMFTLRCSAGKRKGAPSRRRIGQKHRPTCRTEVERSGESGMKSRLLYCNFQLPFVSSVITFRTQKDRDKHTATHRHTALAI